MEHDFTRRQLMRIIQAGGVAITLSNTATAENGSRNATTTIRTMPDKHGPERTGKFVVEFDDDKVAGWKTVTIPAVSIEQGTYREGNEAKEEGLSEPYRRVAVYRETFDDLEMERGVKPGATSVWDWEKQASEGDEKGKKKVAITLMDRSGEPVAQWEFEGAWPKNYEPPDLDASADGDVATESITVNFDKMRRKEV